MWDKVEATPHGRYSNKTEKKVEDELDAKRKAVLFDSHVVLDHFNVLQGNEHAKKEQPKGLKTYPSKQPVKSMDQLVFGVDVKKSF